MADEPTNKQISTDIQNLRTYLTKSDGTPLVTEQFFQKQLPEKWTEHFQSMYDELTKAKKSEFLEAMGLDGFGAALEKYYESRSGADTKWGWYLGSAIVGLMIPAMGVILTAWVVKLQRDIQQLPARLMGNTNGRVLATSNTGRGIRLQNRTDVENREDAAGGNLAAIPRNANFAPLRYQLQLLNPHLDTFNQHAPDFLTNIDKLPSARAIAKTAKAVEKINLAVTASNPTKVGQLADALEKFDPQKTPDHRELDKINKTVAKSNPTKMRELATAVGKLSGAQRHFQPRNLPDAATLSTSARAASQLADAGRNVAQAFNDLKLAARRAAQEIAPTN
ncbi:hypothetical protein [Streptomyces sp. NPDC002825]|uniref:hypothetical protein n=1 Tax=Streptomyces sp. NPDC002825 TaxID=3154666 RepID=UPI00332C6C43